MKFNDFKDKIDQKRREVDRNNSSGSRIKYLEAILDITSRINKTLILEDVLKQVLINAIQLAEADRGFIVLLNSENSLEYKLGINSTGNVLPSQLFQISQSVVEKVFHEKRSLFIEFAQSGEDDAPSKSILNLDLQTILCSPLITDDKKIGVIYVDSKSLRKIKNKEMTDTFEILAGQAAIAIKNAQLYKVQQETMRALRESNQNLRLAKIEAENSNKLKSEFLSQMSHEIRTPLNILMGFSNLLKEEFEEVSNKKHKDILEMFDLAGQRLMQTIDSILEMSQIQTGNYVLEPVRLNLHYDVLFDIAEKFRADSYRKNLGFVYSYHGTDVEIVADRFMVRQAISKILENAVKFTNTGVVSLIMEPGNGHGISVTIRDTGIGISEEYQRKLFTAFSQEESGYSRRYDGNGLGLAIAKKYLDLNSIKVAFTSTKDLGTEFTLQFNRS